MALWTGLGQAATVAQLVGADVGGLISMIVQAALTARQNKTECEQLARRALMIAQLLPHVQEPEAAQPLAGLGDTLRDAHELVVSCQGRGAAYQFVMAGRTAERFREVQSKIDSYLFLFPIISHIGITRRLERIYNILVPDDSTRGEPSPLPLLQEFTEVAQEATPHGTHELTLAEIMAATNNFSPDTVIGEGGSAKLYRGRLYDGREVAIKRFDKRRLEYLEEEFRTELDILSSLRHKHIICLLGSCVTVKVQTIGQTFHKNLVRLLGLCNEGTHRLLVYEFMTNGSLNEFFFGDARPHWSLRVQVALGVARGLLYLHEECSTQIIHCDIKPQNILLDDNFMAKIANFGLAELLRANQTQTNTGIRGTQGYIAPEWFKNIGITSKVDVYSFGVILLELVCCRRNVELEMADEEQAILTYWANDCYRSGRIDLLVEGDEEAIFNIKKAERFVAVALWCLQEEPTMRPTMLKVTQMLDGAVQIPTPPDPSSFISSLE